MDKILLSNEDIEFLLHWRDNNKDLVRSGVTPMKHVKIECVDSGYAIAAIRDKNVLRLSISRKGVSIGNVKYEMLSSGMYRLLKDKTDLSDEDKQSVLTVYCSVMALLVFGSSTVDIPQPKERITSESYHKPKNVSKKANAKGATYILSMREGKPRMIVKGSHSSPRCAFSVRGHYRHYKSGKVVWIEEYTKGSGKKKDKTYKVGMRGEI